MIVRTWRGWVRSEDAAGYVTYIDETGMREYRETPGNLAAAAAEWAASLPSGL